MHNMYHLRDMWKDTLQRKNLQITDLDQATQDLINAYEIKAVAFDAKAASWETAKTTAETLQRELMIERSEMMSADNEINRAIMTIRNTPPLPTPPTP